MKRFKKPIQIILALIFIVLFTVYISKEDSKQGCQHCKRYLLEMKIDGMVIGKFNDISDHNLPKIKVIDSLNNIFTYCLNRDRNNLFDTIYIYDVLYKEINTKSVKIIRGRESFIHQMSCKCD